MVISAHVYVSQNCYMKFRTERSLKESVSLAPLNEDTKYSGEDILPLFKVHFDSFILQNNSTELKLNIQWVLLDFTSNTNIHSPIDSGETSPTSWWTHSSRPSRPCWSPTPRCISVTSTSRPASQWRSLLSSVGFYKSQQILEYFSFKWMHFPICFLPC